MKTLKHTFLKFNLKFIIYGWDENDRYELLNSIDEIEDKDTTTRYLLLFIDKDEIGDNMNHKMYII
jgi:hypothetical protein